MTVQLIMLQRPNEISTFKGLASALTLLCLTLNIKDAEGYHESGRPRKIDGRIIDMSIPEEVKLGTIVGSLSEGHGQSRFKLQKPDNESLVALDELSGQVKIVRKVDREELCAIDTQPCFIYFDVVVNEQPSELLHIHLEVIDINDNPPIFLQPSIALKISKDAALGTRLPLQRAQDQDTGANGMIHYSLESPFDGGEVYPFSLNIDSSRDLPQLQVSGKLDQEQQVKYELWLVARDNGTPPLQDHIKVLISIVNTNDNSPKFNQVIYTTTVPEDMAPGTMVLPTKATSPNSDAGAVMEYKLRLISPVEEKETFLIDPHSGEILLQQALDREHCANYYFTVEARDQNIHLASSQSQVLIRISDINDNPPTISVNMLAAVSEVTYLSALEMMGSVSEDMAPGTILAFVKLMDPDFKENGTVSCSLSGGGGNFALQLSDQGNYALILSGVLNREAVSQHRLLLLAMDGGDPPLISQHNIIVQVLDSNDNRPYFEPTQLQLTAFENLPPGSPLGRVIAYDFDDGKNGNIIYTLRKCHPSGLLSVDPNSGDIVLVDALDYEQKDARFVHCEVNAHDQGIPPLVAEPAFTLNITVADVNDNAPVVMKPPIPSPGISARVFIPAAASRVFPVLYIIAEDLDSGDNGRLVYNLKTENGVQPPFSLNSTTGQLFTTEDLQRHTTESWNITVIVSDCGIPSLSVDIPIILITEPSEIGGWLGWGPGAALATLGLAFALLVALLSLAALRCGRSKRDGRSYNCRLAESAHRAAPRRPAAEIDKMDILLVTGDGGRKMGGTVITGPHQQQSPSIGSSLSRDWKEKFGPFTEVGSYRDPPTTSPSGASAYHPPLPLFLPLSSMGNGSSDVQLTQAAPTGEVSQLLVLLRQGGCQPRPCFRGNKYARGTRPSVDLEHGSLKDSGRGESDGGDGDWGGGGRSGLERGWGSGWVAGRMEGGWMAGRPMGRGAASTNEECGLVEGALLLREAFLKDCQTAFREVDGPQVSSPSSLSVPPVPPTFSTFGKFRGGGSERGQFYMESFAAPLQIASSSSYKPIPPSSSSQCVLSPLSSCFHQSPSSCSPLSSPTRRTLSPLPSSSLSLSCSPLLLSSTSSPLLPIPSCSPSVKCRPAVKIETERSRLNERRDGREIDGRMERELKQNVEVEGQGDEKNGVENGRETRDVRGRNIETANKVEKRKNIDKIFREDGGDKGSRKETDEGLGGFRGREEEGFDHVLSLLGESAQSGSLWLDPEEMVAEVTRLLLQR
uniref:protocadherin 18-like n=1 Tax=Myxine glutinosa TaxID=7769 RepID=UPI00359007EF